MCTLTDSRQIEEQKVAVTQYLDTKFGRGYDEINYDTWLITYLTRLP
jgi:hypothetical protein